MKLAKDLIIRGDVEALGELTLEGRIEGRVRAGQLLVIDAGAEVEAELEAPRIEVAGRVRGRIHARQSLRLEAGAVVIGDVTAAQLSVADGAVVRGRIEMAVELPEELR